MNNNEKHGKTCLACDIAYETFMRGPMAEFCPVCQRIYGIYTFISAERLCRVIEETPPAKRGMVLAEWEEGLRGGSGGARQPIAPPIDQVAVNQAIRSMVDYGLVAPLTSPPEKATTYVIAANGLVEVRHTDMADIILPIAPSHVDCVTCKKAIAVPLGKIIGVTEALTPGIKLNLPKLPYEFLKQTVAFFRETCVRRKQSSEALVRIWWNRSTASYEIKVPLQNVSGASVTHEDNFDRDNDGTWLHVADIHSHGTSMGGFWSGTDDADERKAPEGRLFGVIGQVDLPLPSWKWRMRTREGFIDLGPSDIFDLSQEADIPFHVTMEVLMDVLRKADNRDAKGRISLSCPVDPFKDATCPNEWHEQVSTTIVRSSSSGGHGWPGWAGNYRSTFDVSFIYIKVGSALEEFKVEGKEISPTGVKVPLVVEGRA